LDRNFLGGPLVAGYFISENFKVFDDERKARNTILISIVFTVFLFSLIFLIPQNIKIPNQIIPLIYTGIAYFLVQHYQGKKN